jgi:hypothetical protein
MAYAVTLGHLDGQADRGVVAAYRYYFVASGYEPAVSSYQYLLSEPAIYAILRMV